MVGLVKTGLDGVGASDHHDVVRARVARRSARPPRAAGIRQRSAATDIDKADVRMDID
jgi:hypothetical protein